MSPTSGAHILVFPHPAQGHMIALLDLAHQLSARGLYITILVTPKNLPILEPLLSKSPSIQTLIFPLPTHPSIPPGVENVKDFPPTASAADIVHALSALRDPILHWFRSHPSPPVAILSDFFLGWTQTLARQLGIPRIVFYGISAFLISALNELWKTNVRWGNTAPSVVSLTGVPNSPAFEYRQLPAIYRRCEEFSLTSEDWAFMKDGMIENMSSWGGIYNTFDAMEGAYLEHLRKGAGHGRVWAVGPVSLKGLGPTARGGASLAPIGEVMTWLDGCPEGSVVYVCFGSEVVLTRQQMAEVASALEKSGTRFVWAVKNPTSADVAEGEHGLVPQGFEEGANGRVIRGWTPQVEILGHRATGAFLTHCGWNSVLEGIVAGVNLLAWPMGADQFINARLLVEEMGVAVRVCEGGDSVPDSDKLARFLAESVSRNPSRRVGAVELKKAALEAVKEGGSSFRDLDEVVKELCKLGSKSEIP